MRRAVVTSVGGVTAAFIGSLCCAGPLLFVTLGVGAGLASTFGPLRPLFGAAMVGFFGFGFYRVYGSRSADVSAPAASPEDDQTRVTVGGACELPRRRKREAVMLWTAAGIALVLWTFPTWSQVLL